MPDYTQPQAITAILMASAMVAITLGVSTYATAATTAKEATAQLINLQNKPIGTAILTETPDGVRIQLDATNLPAGELAFHIHEKGICDASKKFTTAGAHFNPLGKDHGMKSAHGAHAGDMMNLTIGKDGTLHTMVVNPGVTLDDGRTGLLDADGSALVIHTKADDYQSQPSGNAGDRLACGIIRLKE